MAPHHSAVAGGFGRRWLASRIVGATAVTDVIQPEEAAKDTRPFSGRAPQGTNLLESLRNEQDP